MKQYNEYKDSGHEAIGSIPKKWFCTSIKNVLQIPITDGPHTTPKFYDEGIPFISAEAIKNGKIDFSRKRGYISKEDYQLFSKKYLPKIGDIYMVKSGATTGNVAIVDFNKEFTIWSPLAVFRANQEKISPYFLHYYLQSPNFRSLVEISWSYGTQQNIGMGVLSKLPIACPSLPEQEKITQFLDHQTQIIDALVAKKEALIEKLQLQRQTIINEAVTKGLHPNAPMKDSGIEWLGEIPAHWDEGKLKVFCSKITDGSHHSPETILEGGKRYVSVKDVGSNEIFFENCKRISEEDFIQLAKNGCQPQKGDILLTKDGTIGRAVVVGDDIDFVILSSLGIIRPNFSMFIPEFLREFLVSNLSIQQMRSLIQGAALTRITIGIIKNLQVIIPPLEEQTEIVSFIDQQTQRIDQLIAKSQKSIEKLKTYRQTIISEAVTGKVDVSGWAG